MHALLMSVLSSLAVAGLAGCGDEVENGAATGGTCDKASIERAVQQVGVNEKTTATLSKNGFACEADWAVAEADVGAPATAVTETLIFRARGQAWVVQDRAKVCATPSPIPAAISKEACGSN